MTPNPLSTPVRADNGAIVLRVGFVFVLFIRKAHHEIAETVARAYEHFESLVGSQNLQWIHDRGEYFRPLTKQRRTRLLESLRADSSAPESDPMFTVKGGCGESDAVAFEFQYSGENMKGRLAGASASALQLAIPSDLAEERTWLGLVTGLLEIADSLPFSSGYGSLGLQRVAWAESATDAMAVGLTRRYPGLDLNDTSGTALRIGDDARGAYWLTLLSHANLQRLGMDAEALKTRLPPQIKIHSMRNGVAIQAGEAPSPGDVNRNDRLPLVRSVAALIEPIRHTQRVAIFGYRELEDFVAWQARHVR